MDRCVTTIHRLMEALLPLVLQLAPAVPLRRILYRALPCEIALRSIVPGSMRITIELKLRISFQSEGTEPGNVVEMNPIGPIELVEAEAIENQDIPPHTSLMGSLYGILDHHDA